MKLLFLLSVVVATNSAFASSLSSLAPNPSFTIAELLDFNLIEHPRLKDANSGTISVNTESVEHDGKVCDRGEIHLELSQAETSKLDLAVCISHTFELSQSVVHTGVQFFGANEESQRITVFDFSNQKMDAEVAYSTHVELITLDANNEPIQTSVFLGRPLQEKPEESHR